MMKRVPVYSLQGNNTSCSFLQPEKFSVREIRQQRSNFPAAPGCIWPSLCCVCVDLVLNKDLTQVSGLAKSIRTLRGEILDLAINVPRVPARKRRSVFPQQLNKAHTGPSILALSTSSLPLLACRTQNGNDYLDRGLENVWATSTLFLQIAGFCTSCNNVLKL